MSVKTMNEAKFESFVANAYSGPFFEGWDSPEHMPAKYLERIRSEDRSWHRVVLQAFFDQLPGAENRIIKPVMRWRHFPQRGYTEVTVCAVDQPRLLEKIAGTFSISGINIFHAEVYTRKDGVALDIFKVSDEDRHIAAENRLQKVFENLLLVLNVKNALPNKQLEIERSVFSSSQISHHDQSSEGMTVIEVQAQDYIGLLRDILKIFSAYGLNIHEAWVHTEKGHAVDIFCVSDPRGNSLSPLRVKEIKQELQQRLGSFANG